jgi:hypothetical protein
MSAWSSRFQDDGRSSRGGVDRLSGPPAAATGRSKKEVHVGEVVYRSQVRVTRHQGPLRTATVPAEDRLVTFGVHGAVAEHYGTDPEETEPHATTLDYLVAAAAG